MLVEYALTPDVFDEHLGREDATWRDRIRQLGRALFPSHIARTAIISDLYGGSWSHQLRQVVDAAEHPATADLLRRLRSQIEDACVTRPARGDYPPDEAGWITSARQFESDVPIDRVVTSDAYIKGGPRDARLHGLSSTQEDAFWRGTGPTRHPPMVLGHQIKALAPICLHSSFIAFASPQIRSGGSGDFDFLAALIQQFGLRPADFARSKLFDIHTKGDANEVIRNTSARRVIDELRQRIPNRSASVRLFLWPTLLERVLIAGDITGPPEKFRLRSRWGISLTHVCRPAIDGPNADPPTWTMLAAADLARWRTRLYGTAGNAVNGPRYPGDSPFSESPVILAPSA